MPRAKSKRLRRDLPPKRCEAPQCRNEAGIGTVMDVKYCSRCEPFHSRLWSREMKDAHMEHQRVLRSKWALHRLMHLSGKRGMPRFAAVLTNIYKPDDFTGRDMLFFVAEALLEDLFNERVQRDF